MIKLFSRQSFFKLHVLKSTSSNILARSLKTISTIPAQPGRPHAFIYNLQRYPSSQYFRGTGYRHYRTFHKPLTPSSTSESSKKRIVIACDGTGQSATRGKLAVSTNVERFCQALQNGCGSSNVQQIVFYQSGIGTADLGLSGVGKLVQGALGDGIEENIADAYSFVMNNYLPGDEIFIFGFSRGAFTARVLANIICRLGIFTKRYSKSLKVALQAYKEGPKRFNNFIRWNKMRDIEDRKAWRPGDNPYVPRRHGGVTVKIVGCWDTVASLGIQMPLLMKPGGVSGEYRHYDGGLVHGIENAFHAIALDEYRSPFTPTLWYSPTRESCSKAHSGKPCPIDLRQCWFPGVHGNVGGGYPDQALADLTLAWMIDLCRPYLDFRPTFIKGSLDLHHSPSKIRSRHRTGFDNDYKGWAQGKQYESYKRGQLWTWTYRTPGGYEQSTDSTRETMHASVRERWEKIKSWRPQALNGFTPRQRPDGQWQWAKDGTVIEEENFDSKTVGNYEWLLRYPTIAGT